MRAAQPGVPAEVGVRAASLYAIGTLDDLAGNQRMLAPLGGEGARRHHQDGGDRHNRNGVIALAVNIKNALLQCQGAFAIGAARAPIEHPPLSFNPIPAIGFGTQQSRIGPVQGF